MPILRQLVFANSCQLALGLCLFVANFYFYWYRQIRRLQNKQFHLCMFWILQVGFVFLILSSACLLKGEMIARGENQNEKKLTMWRWAAELYFVY